MWTVEHLHGGAFSAEAWWRKSSRWDGRNWKVLKKMFQAVRGCRPHITTGPQHRQSHTGAYTGTKGANIRRLLLFSGSPSSPWQQEISSLLVCSLLPADAPDPHKIMQPILWLNPLIIMLNKTLFKHALYIFRTQVISSSYQLSNSGATYHVQLIQGYSLKSYFQVQLKAGAVIILVKSELHS